MNFSQRGIGNLMIMTEKKKACANIKASTTLFITRGTSARNTPVPSGLHQRREAHLSYLPS